MAKAIALVTADWHVRKHDRIWSRRAEIYGDGAYGMQQVIELARKHNTPDVIIAGDVLEDKLQPSDATYALRLCLDHLEEDGRRILYVQGQHEKSTPPWLRALHKAPMHVHHQLVSARGAPDIRYYGLDYEDALRAPAALQQIPAEANVLVTHQVWKETMGEERGLASMVDVPRNIALTISGDYHKAMHSRFGQSMFLSPGPLCMQDLREAGPKSVYVLFDNLSIVQEPLRCRQCFEFDINTDDELDEFVSTWHESAARIPQAFVPPHIARNIVRVKCSTNIPHAKAKLTSALAPDVHLFVTPVRHEVEAMGAAQRERCEAVMAGGLRGCIDRLYAEPRDVHDTAVRLEACRNIDEELLTIYKELVAHGSNGN
jgi:hypothetical protein